MSRTRKRGQPSYQVVDPAVSQAKFDREVRHFRTHAVEHRRRGCLLLEASFPTVLLAFGVPSLRPWPLLFGVSVDFMNYDAVSLSVSVVNPWTGAALRKGQVPPGLPRFTPSPKDLFKILRKQAYIPNGDLLQSEDPPHDVPFVCTPGTREYHWHPAHSGDSWWLYRGRGRGTLDDIKEVFLTHAVGSVADFAVDVEISPPRGGQVQVSARVNGYLIKDPSGKRVGKAT